MKAEIIRVGTEMLTGQIVDTNSQFLSEQFAQYGIDVFYHTSVGDNEQRLLDLLAIAQQRSQLVVLCGGLGPTDDDLTKQVLAKFLNRSLVFDEQAAKRLDEFFATRPQSSRTPNNERQAQIIEGAEPLQNSTGLAVGGMITVDGVRYVVLPGPPSELKPMVLDELLPRLIETNQRLYSRVLRFFGIGESRLVTLIDDLIKEQTDPTIAPYAKTGEVTLRLSTKANSQEEADRKFDPLEEKIVSIESLGDLLYGYGEQNTLAKVVVEALKEKGLTLTAAESLTGGLFQSTVTEISGSSTIFKGGFVTYSNEQKAKMLGISLEEIEENGAVSAITAEQMADGARRQVGADIAVSMTGVAGPDELEGQPVGKVFLGLATANGTHSIEVMIGGRSRQDVRQVTVLHAFNLIRQVLAD